ncbi:uncharacterized protein LOC134980219 isoform X2 [Pseudophryne corroboree]|uniref:uncharacterized protein LOC134980219 isoform X2 n=1 Tax=Pseudophryne corroboree TaxID=495146 RepID=UPI003081F4DE
MAAATLSIYLPARLPPPAVSLSLAVFVNGAARSRDMTGSHGNGGGTYCYRCARAGVLGETSCGERIEVSGLEGGDVTLPVGETGIRDISWVADMRLIVKTKWGKPVVVHNGRLSVTSNGSLIIANLSREDQRIYTANIRRQLSGQCTQIYDLRVYEPPRRTSPRPSTSQTTAGTHTGRNQKKDYRRMIIIRLTFSACVFCLTCCAFLHHVISDRINRSPDSG